MPAAFVALAIVSRLTPPPGDEVQALIDRIRDPRPDPA
jgi:Na+(H+)/acetate symporter ActP